jgi:cytochrome o ubiquinol oxidase operon protein cyoD
MSDLPKVKAHRGTLLSYSFGFLLSVVLTELAYVLVVHKSFSYKLLIVAILCLAVVQLMVQLLFFLHLTEEKKPRWNQMAFGFMTMVLVILVFGSLWIMHNLDYHTMSPHDTDTYIQDEEGIHKQ